MKEQLIPVTEAITIAEQLYQTKQFEQAQHIYEQILPLLYSRLGNVYSEQGKFTEAIAHYRESLRIKPDCDETFYKLGFAFQCTEQVEQAIDCYLKALSFANEWPIDRLYEVSFALQKFGKLHEAYSCYQIILQAQPDRVEIHFHAAEILIEQKRYAEAFKHLSKVEELAHSTFENRQLSPHFYFMMAEALVYLRRSEASLRYLEQVENCVSEVLKNVSFYGKKAEILFLNKNYREAQCNINKTLALEPRNPASHALMSNCLLYQGLLDEAEYYFHHFPDSAPSNFVSHGENIHLSQEFYTKISEFQSNFTPFCVEKISAITHSDAINYVMLITCDMRYFHEYGINYLSSFAKNTNNHVLLHLHVINANKEFDIILDKLLNKIVLPNFCVTTESFDLEISEQMRVTYYSCARFVHLSHWLKLYQKTIICTDIDAIVEKPLNTILNSVGYDIGLNLRNPELAPWLDIAAGIVIANPTENSIHFFEMVRNYVLYSAQEKQLHWHLDQIALFCTLKLLERFGTPPNVHWNTDEEQQLLWQIGHAERYRHKLQDERFTRHSIELS